MSGETDALTEVSPGAGVLCLNPGSSSLKWAWFMSMDAREAANSGNIQPGDEAFLQTLISQYPASLAIIRFVHGGNDFVHPTVVSREKIQQLHSLSTLAPLHNNASLALSKRLTSLSPQLKQVAVFDTEFFHELPRTAQLYGIPQELTEKYGIRRFGFHGFAHDGMLKAWDTLTRGKGQGRLVTIQLGSGCSMAALYNGMPQDTTMGFTPNEGLLMSTRSGDIDPGLLTWLQRQEGWSPEETDRILNEESGWFGVSGKSADLSVLLESDLESAKQALALIAHRIRKTLGAYFALLGGLDGVLVSGGVGENAMGFCRRLFSSLEHLGIVLAGEPEDVARQHYPLMQSTRFTLQESAVACLSVHCDEHRSMIDSVRRLETKTGFLNRSITVKESP